MVRVVDLQTSNGSFTRPAVKLFPLPIDSKICSFWRQSEKEKEDEAMLAPIGAIPKIIRRTDATTQSLFRCPA
ncbi:hypothetical protein J6590_081310 [Homalodisca vitripennis]|nr:hypothetical protein J6590_081310 [Homalodisca vitripennis]